MSVNWPVTTLSTSKYHVYWCITL